MLKRLTNEVLDRLVGTPSLYIQLIFLFWLVATVPIKPLSSFNNLPSFAASSGSLELLADCSHGCVEERKRDLQPSPVRGPQSSGLGWCMKVILICTASVSTIEWFWFRFYWGSSCFLVGRKALTSTTWSSPWLNTSAGRAMCLACSRRIPITMWPLSNWRTLKAWTWTPQLVLRPLHFTAAVFIYQRNLEVLSNNPLGNLNSYGTCFK